VTLAQPNRALAPQLSNPGPDPLLPENLLSICLDYLGGLDAEAAAAGIVSADLDWADQMWLTSDELEFGNHLHCDVLEQDTAEAWEAYTGRFISANIPVLSMYRRMAWLGWLKPHSVRDSVLAFMAWGLVFEGVYRLVAHLHGFSVLQRSCFGSEGRCFQYRMLDRREGGLCADPVIAELVSYISPADHEYARRTLKLAVKVRDALAHGAMLKHDEMDHLAAGHVMIKALQLLMGSALHKMSKVSAYYHWKTFRKGADGYELPDWLHGEKQVFDLVDSTIQKQQTVQ